MNIIICGDGRVGLTIEKLLIEQNNSITITVEIGLGNKSFTAYTMDLTKKYIEINSDYRS